MEPVYGSVIRIAKTLFAFEGLRFTRTGSQNIPAVGGAVIAINHTGYMDFTYAGYAAHDVRRFIRFMAKDEVFVHKVSGPLMRGMRHIPVDRASGGGSYREAVERLRAGQLVGVFPEATISRSFELKGFKSGAARMALEAQVPIIPVVIWGSQRVWTKGHPKHLGRTGFPILVHTGKPIAPQGEPDDLTARVKSSMTAILERLRSEYPQPYPQGAYWVPASLGGGAPTLAEATALDEADAVERAEKRRRREQEALDGGAGGPGGAAGAGTGAGAGAASGMRARVRRLRERRAAKKRSAQGRSEPW